MQHGSSQDRAQGRPEELRLSARVECKAVQLLHAACARFRMADETIKTTGIAAHGASRLPWVEIDSFNLELKDEDEFLGTVPARAPSGKLSKNGESRCANLAKIPSGRSFPKILAKRSSTPSLAATIPKPPLSSTAPSRTLHRSSPA